MSISDSTTFKNSNPKNPSKGLVARVTGSLKYVDDIHNAEMLHAKMVRLPVGHAKIDAIDKEAAMRIPGVVAVYSAEDLPSPLSRFGPLIQDQPVLANGEVKFAGQPVAVVVAETGRQAEQGVAAVTVKYTKLTAVTTFEEALAPGAPLVQNPDNRERISGTIQISWERANSDGEI